MSEPFADFLARVDERAATLSAGGEALQPPGEFLGDRAVDGATFIFDEPDDVPAIWGQEDRVLWAAGEPLLIVAPPGVGKTTLGQQLARSRVGSGPSELLGLPVAVEPKRVLYVAADRPRQAARSMKRMVTEAEREKLRDWLVVWPGPLPFDLTKEPERFAEFVAGFDAGTVVIDSLKDVAVGLSDDETGARLNLALQHAVAAGIEVAALHHQRKAQSDNRKPRSLDDVYGSTWITAGAGSVVLLWGEAGDSVVELRHLKQPAADVGPLTLLHDHERGSTSLHNETDLFALTTAAPDGLSVVDAARHLFGSAEPSASEKEKARRRLERLVKEQRIGRVGGGSPSAPSRYVRLELRRAA